MSAITSTTTTNVGLFHRRELKSPAIAFSSLEGRQIFAESLKSGFLDGYFPLAEQFTTQGEPAFCGIASLTMAMNSILIDPKRAWQGSVWRWFDESMLDCCEPIDLIKLNGITLPKLACLAKCNGAGVKLNLASSINVENFRNDIMNVTSSSSETSREVMIVSYSRPILNQTGGGHFSPIGGFHQEKDLVLIMDVARFKYPPHWVPVIKLFESMQTIDDDSGKSRGYILLSKTNELERISCCNQNSISVHSCEKIIDNLLSQSLDNSSSFITSNESNDIDRTSKSPSCRLQSLLNHECSFCTSCNETNLDIKSIKVV